MSHFLPQWNRGVHIQCEFTLNMYAHFFILVNNLSSDAVMNISNIANMAINGNSMSLSHFCKSRNYDQKFRKIKI